MEKLYHINRYDLCYGENEEYNGIEVGKEYIFNKDRMNNFRYGLMDLQSSLYAGNITKNGKDYTYYESFYNLLNYEELKKKSPKEIENIVNKLRSYITRDNIFRRESILEEVRIEENLDLPSRYHCMWLTDEECIDNWIDLLDIKGNQYNIYEMELDGNIFVSTNELLPNANTPLIEMYNQALKYWNPSEEDLNSSKRREYLFEGKAKVKSKIK